jgi:hypothetical protein
MTYQRTRTTQRVEVFSKITIQRTSNHETLLNFKKCATARERRTQHTTRREESCVVPGYDAAAAGENNNKKKKQQAPLVTIMHDDTSIGTNIPPITSNIGYFTITICYVVH